jgi:hypothetical protein
MLRNRDGHSYRRDAAKSMRVAEYFRLEKRLAVVALE